MPFVDLPNTFPNVSNAHVLSNGKVLLNNLNGASYLYEPDAFGSYANGTLRRIADSPYGHQWGPLSMTNSGKLILHSGEYGTSSTGIPTGGLDSSGRTSVYDPQTESWEGFTGYVATHSALFVTDDGRHFAIKVMAADQVNPSTAVNGPQNSLSTTAGEQQSSAGETPMCTLPDGRALVVRTAAAASPNNSQNRKIDYIHPTYSAGFVSAGSFSGGTDDIQTVNLATEMDALGKTFRSYEPHWGATGNYIHYEMGPTIWNPKLGKVVHFAGTGEIFTIDPSTNAVARPASLPLEPPPSDPNSLYTQASDYWLGGWNPGLFTPFVPNANHKGYWGTVAATSAGRTRTQILADQQAATNIYFFVNTDDTTDMVNAKLAQYNTTLNPSGNVNGKVLYVYTTGNTAVTAFRFETVDFIGGQYRFKIGPKLAADATYSDIFNDSTVIDSGAYVMNGRPYLCARDVPCVILPNGDMIVKAGITSSPDQVDNFDTVSRYVKFDGSTCTSMDVVLGNSYGTWMTLLPDGSVLTNEPAKPGAGGSGLLRRYVPTTTEATPTSGSRPSISTFPDKIEAGQTTTMVGVQLNGLHEGSAFGDDHSERSNFPVVRFTNKVTGRVYYARTYNFSYRGIQPGRASSCSVQVPSTMPTGNYFMETVANGVPSLPRDVTVAPVGGESIFMNYYR